jgi:hypothetical protein
MNVDWELDDLEKVFTRYGFNTERWLIPTKNSHIKLMSKAIDVVEKHEEGEDLVIVYYAGHGAVNGDRKATWSWYVVRNGFVSPSFLESGVGICKVEVCMERANFGVELVISASLDSTLGAHGTDTLQQN